MVDTHRRTLEASRLANIFAVFETTARSLAECLPTKRVCVRRSATLWAFGVSLWRRVRELSFLSSEPTFAGPAFCASPPAARRPRQTVNDDEGRIISVRASPAVPRMRRGAKPALEETPKSPQLAQATRAPSKRVPGGDPMANPSFKSFIEKCVISLRLGCRGCHCV